MVRVNEPLYQRRCQDRESVFLGINQRTVNSIDRFGVRIDSLLRRQLSIGTG